MAISLVQSTSNHSNAANTLTKAYTSDNTAGNTLVVLAYIHASGSTPTLTIADTQLNTYNLAIDLTISINQHLYGWVVPSAAAGANTVTITELPTGGEMTLDISEWSGSSGVVDKTITANAGSGTQASSNMSPSEDGELILGFVIASGACGAADLTQLIATSGAAFDYRSEYQIQTTATAVPISFTGGSGQWDIIGFTLKAAVSTVDLPKSVSDDLNAYSDTIKLIEGYLSSQSDNSLNLSDGPSFIYGTNLSQGDQLSILDSFGNLVGSLISLNDQLVFSDALNNRFGTLLALTETLQQLDSTSLQYNYLLSTFSDTLSLLEQVELLLSSPGAYSLNISDALALTDELLARLHHLLNISDQLVFSDRALTNGSSFVAGLFTLQDIVDRIRQTIDNPVYWTPEDLNASTQDGYDEIIATTGSLLKTAVLPFTQDVLYYDLRELIPDYSAVTAIFNNVTKRWLIPTSINKMDQERQDWEKVKSNPEYFIVVSHRYVAIPFRVSSAAYGNMYVFYRASANALTSDSQIRFNNDFISALEEYAVMDLLEQNQEFTKASARFKEYLTLVAQLETWVKELRETDRIPSLRPSE